MSEAVVILGASDKPHRIAYKAYRMLKTYGHHPIPVSPRIKELEGQAVFATLGEIHQCVDTLTLYVGAETSEKLRSEILRLNPRRVIFNPGSENASLAESLRKNGVTVVEDCTLVMLQSGRY